MTDPLLEFCACLMLGLIVAAVVVIRTEDKK